MRETYADQLDNASELDQSFRDASVAVARAKNKPEQVQGENGEWEYTECVDCDEPIPEGRLNLGKIRCVECQEFLERRTR